MKEIINEQTLRWAPWKPELKRLARKFYQEAIRREPEIVNQALATKPRLRQITDEYLSNQFPSQHEVARRLGVSPILVNLATRAALIRILWAEEGKLQEAKMEIPKDAPEILPTGPGYGKHGRRNGVVELDDNTKAWLDYWQNVFGRKR